MILDIEVKQILRANINKPHNILYTHMFIDIQNNLERIMDAHKASYDPDLECILETDRRTRMETLQTAMKQGEL